MPMFIKTPATRDALSRWHSGEELDVPHPPDDEYTTHKPIGGVGESTITEEGEPKKTPEEETDVTQPSPEEMSDPAGIMDDPSSGMDPGDQGAPGMDGMDGFGQEDEGPKSPEDVGRVYELKKIHSRLVSIESYLSSSSDEKLIKLRNYVSKAIELFDSLISNVDLFKDKLPDIIVTYYKFLDSVYSILSTHYKKKESEEKKEK